MATSHKLVKTNQVGFVLVDELSRNTQGARDLLEVTKQASECVPDRILPDPDLKTMRDTFEEKLNETNVIDAFEPYRDEQPGSSFDPKNQVVYSVNFDYIPNGVGAVAIEGNESNGEVADNDMIESRFVPLNDLDYVSPNNFELIFVEDYPTVIKVYTAGLYCFTGEFTLQILPWDIESDPSNANTFYPPDFLRDGDDEIKYRITLQQIIGGDGPYDEVPATIVDNFLLAKGSFNKVDIVKGERRQHAFNVILRANAEDKFRVLVERTRLIGRYPDSDMPDALVFVKVGEESNDPYFQNRDHSNYIRFICLVGTTPEA